MKKKDIILRVWGGVGNQLFIYAFAKVLSLITDCKVTLDIRTGFANDGYKRVYRLGDFSISLLPALRFYTLLSFAQRKMPYIRHLLAYKFDFFEENQKYPLETLDSFFKIYSDKNLYLQGYWQYFDFSSYRDVLLKDLRFEVEINNTYLYYSDLIEKSNAVAIHFRRIQYEPVISIDYYKKAIKYISENVENPTFFIFSDDINWCRENLSINGICFFVENFKDELYFMLLFLQSKMVFYRNTSFFCEIKKYHQEIDSNIYQANQFFFQNIGLLFNQFEFDYDELEKELYVIHTRLLFKSFYNYVPIGEHHNLYPEDMAIVQENLRVRFENICPRNSLIYSQLDYAIFLYAALSIANEFMTEYELSIFIDDSKGEFNSIWLKKFFMKSTNGLVKLNFVDPNRFLLADESVDLIISTNKFFPIKNVHNKPILFLECKDKYEDLKNVQSMVRKIMMEKNKLLQVK